MKKLIASLFTLALLVSGNSYAKGFAKKGTITLGTSVSSKHGNAFESSSIFALSPGGQYFVDDNIALGAKLLLGRNKSCGENCDNSLIKSSLGLNVMPAYYHPLDNQDMFLVFKGQLGYVTEENWRESDGDTVGDTIKENSMIFGAETGIAMPFATVGGEKGGVVELSFEYQIANNTQKSGGSEKESSTSGYGLVTSFAVFF